MISGKIGGRIGPPGIQGEQGPIGSIQTGTGSPQGVVSAPVGTTYIDSSATNGAVEWIKVSGTGTSGWRVKYGDTGWRTLAPLFVNGWTEDSAGFVAVRRTGAIIHVRPRALNGSGASASQVATLPQGFIPTIATGGPVMSTTGTVHSLQVAGGSGGGSLTLGNAAGSVSYTTFVGQAQQVSFPARDDGIGWPAVLPGDPA